MRPGGDRSASCGGEVGNVVKRPGEEDGLAAGPPGGCPSRAGVVTLPRVPTAGGSGRTQSRVTVHRARRLRRQEDKGQEEIGPTCSRPPGRPLRSCAPRPPPVPSFPAVKCASILSLTN